MRLLRLLSLLLLLVPAISLQSPAADLKASTRQAFIHYTEIAEAGMRPTLQASGPFLWIDRLDKDKRAEVMAKLKKGEVVIERMQEQVDGHEINIPDGMVHDWLGTVFVPGVDIPQTLKLLQDYDHHKDVYKSDVVDSKLLSRHGDDFEAYMRFYKKKIIGVTVDTYHTAHYGSVSPTRAYSISHTTRVNEVDDAGTPAEHQEPQGEGHGFLWALNSYWRLEQKDGGVYIECRALTLTRDIPTGLGWIIKPFVTEVPRESLMATLGSTRRALKKTSTPQEGK